jgi:hypothetical protein
MNTFRKYEFGSQGAATTKINALGLDEEGNPTHSHAIVHLGHLVVTEGTYDDEGNELTHLYYLLPIIDVLWDGEPVESWDSAMVWCAPMGIHTFGSSSAIREWTEKCKELHPEYFPEPSEEL